MGRARRGGAPPARGLAAAGGGRHGGGLRFSHAALAAACCFGGLSCEGLTSSPSTPYAITIIAPPDSMHVHDTVVIHAIAINRNGDSIPGAPLRLISLNPDTLAVDSALFAVVAETTGTGRAIVKTGNLTSNPFLIPIK